MNWNNINNGYEFRIYFKQEGSCTVETINCSLNEEERFQKIVKIMEHLKNGIDRYFESCTEKVAEYISKKTGIEESEILGVIENIVLSDIKYEEHIASVSHIEVFRSENGKVQVTSI